MQVEIQVNLPGGDSRDRQFKVSRTSITIYHGNNTFPVKDAIYYDMTNIILPGCARASGQVLEEGWLLVYTAHVFTLAPAWCVYRKAKFLCV
jgi:hypothetical protein